MGNAVVNEETHVHFQPTTGLFEVKLRRHQANISVDAWTTTCDETEWRSIVSAAKNTQLTDAQFADVLADVWPQWTQDHVKTPGLEGEYRTLVLKIVDP